MTNGANPEHQMSQECAGQDESATSIERIVPTRLTTIAPPERRPEAAHVKAQSESASESELVSQSIRPFTTSANKPSVTINGWKSNDLRDRPDEGIDDAEYDGHPEERQPLAYIGHPWHHPRGDPERRGVHEQASQKSHDSTSLIRLVNPKFRTTIRHSATRFHRAKIGCRVAEPAAGCRSTGRRSSLTGHQDSDHHWRGLSCYSRLSELPRHPLLQRPVDQT